MGKKRRKRLRREFHGINSLRTARFAPRTRRPRQLTTELTTCDAPCAPGPPLIAPPRKPFISELSSGERFHQTKARDHAPPPRVLHATLVRANNARSSSWIFPINRRQLDQLQRLRAAWRAHTFKSFIRNLRSIYPIYIVAEGYETIT